MPDKKPTHIAIFKVKVEDKTVYYVQGTQTNTVHAWASEQEGLRYFEEAFETAVRRGGGWAAGAMLDDMYLQPRVYNYGGDRDKLVELLGGEIIKPVKLTGTGVRETVFQIPDQTLAEKVYDKSTRPQPRL
jgi:hypothetical protein